MTLPQAEEPAEVRRGAWDRSAPPPSLWREALAAAGRPASTTADSERLPLEPGLRCSLPRPQQTEQLHVVQLGDRPCHRG